MSQTPLYDATLSATLARLRAEAGAQATAAVQVEVAAAKQQAAQAREDAERARRELEQVQVELARVRREVGIRAALREAEVEEMVRSALVHAPAPLQPLAPAPQQVGAEEDDGGPVAPTVPSFADLRTPSHRVDAFFDALLGP